MSDLDLPVIDKELGIVVKDVMVDGYSGTGWYVHLIPPKDSYKHARWRNSDKLGKWCNEELVLLPDDNLPDDVDEEYVVDVMERMLLRDGRSGCKRCHECVPVGSLNSDGGPVGTLCDECAGCCPKCGHDEWESLGKKKKNSARHGARSRCKDCGYTKEKMPTG